MGIRVMIAIAAAVLVSMKFARCQLDDSAEEACKTDSQTIAALSAVGTGIALERGDTELANRGVLSVIYSSLIAPEYCEEPAPGDWW